MREWILDALLAAIRLFIDGVTATADGLMNGFIDTIPVLDGTALEPFSLWLGVANQWLPLDAAVALIAAYFTFLTAFITVKFVIKLIPTVG